MSKLKVTSIGNHTEIANPKQVLTKLNADKDDFYT